MIKESASRERMATAKQQMTTEAVRLMVCGGSQASLQAHPAGIITDVNCTTKCR